MNKVPEAQTAVEFATDGYQVLVVAEKFQTGFDQPLLCGMYVDRRLAGIQAVQTLSRLNRAHPGKDTTYVLDFVNHTEEILAAFKTYHTTVELSATTDPNLVFNLRAKLAMRRGDREAALRDWTAMASDKALLPTIRSRCRHVLLSTPTIERIADQLVSRFGVDPAQAMFAATVSENRNGSSNTTPMLRRSDAMVSERTSAPSMRTAPPRTS
mgnify:CR=1 FL=1